MDKLKKENLLINCNSIPTEAIITFIVEGSITLVEFEQAGLAKSTITLVQQLMEKGKDVTDAEGKKERVLRLIKSGRIEMGEIQAHINKKLISFDDLEDTGLSTTLINSFKHFLSTDRIRKSKNIDELPPMQEGRTDVYFIGVAGSGKSTMLAGLLKIAHTSGILLADPSSGLEGSNYQRELIQDLNKGVLPLGTEVGAYNYVALSFKDETGREHPFNIVDVPGENYKSIVQNAEVEALLRYINNSNKKILIFVIDSLSHENGYNDGRNSLDQSIAYVNIMQMFASHGIFEKTDAVYFIVNKFDALKESRYAHDDRKNGDLALEYLEEEFKGLIENCKSIRNNTRFNFPIKVMPFSIGSISYNYILNHLNKDFPTTLLNQLMKDSFIIKGGTAKIFKQ
jgi:hypothetical protein